MEAPHFIKCELSSLSDTKESCDLGKYVHVPADHFKIKTEPHHAFSEPSFEEATTENLKRELEIEVPNQLFATTDDKLAVVKVEPLPVLASETVEGAGASTVSEEHEIQDVKIGTQTEGCNTLEDTLQDMETASVLTKEILHECNVCSMKFNGRSTLERHMLSHTGERQYECAICNFMFIRKDTLREHLLNHSREKQFKCSTCGSTFARSAYLRRHENVHSGGPFPCSVCGINYTMLSELRKHENAHADNRPYSCTVCGCAFKRSSTLRKHKVTHSDNRPFSCSVCGGTFKYMSTLARHQNVHADCRPFCCSICGNSFTRSSLLKAHIKTHAETS